MEGAAADGGDASFHSCDSECSDTACLCIELVPPGLDEEEKNGELTLFL